MANLSDQIEAEAAKPLAASNDMGSVSKRPLTELIEADKYLAEKSALTDSNSLGGPKSGWRAARPARGIPPGAV